MTRCYLLRSPRGKRVRVAFSIPRRREPGFMIAFRAACARLFVEWERAGYLVIRRLPTRKIRPDPRRVVGPGGRGFWVVQ
jgi:hypothetical protein